MRVCSQNLLSSRLGWAELTRLDKSRDRLMIMDKYRRNQRAPSTTVLKARTKDVE